MREHTRARALLHHEGDAWEDIPDWKLDRLVIRLGLYARERLGLEAGDRLAVFGRLHWLWPIADFAGLGAGAVCVGLSHDLSDASVFHALGEAAPRIAVATDPGSAARLLRLRGSTAVPTHVIVPDGVGDGSPGVHHLRDVLDLGGTLDTAERAQAFRAASRVHGPEVLALWHVAASASNGGRIERLTHADAMARVAPRLADSTVSGNSELAYLEPVAVTLSTRLAYLGYIGDGRITTAFGREGLVADDLAALRPHRILVSDAWLEQTWNAIESKSAGLLRWLAGRTGAAWVSRWDRGSARHRAALESRLGDRLRTIEVKGPLADTLAERVRQSGVRLALMGNDV
jgi:hypothetical protein